MFRIFAVFAVMLTCVGCTDANFAESEPTFPALSQEIVAERAFQSCGSFSSDGNQGIRAPAISRFDGFSSHVVQLCSGTRSIVSLVFWSKTNAEFTRITSRLTTLSGREIPFTGSTYDPAFGVTTFSFMLLGQSCEIVKPRGGISPSAFIIC